MLDECWVVFCGSLYPKFIFKFVMWRAYCKFIPVPMVFTPIITSKRICLHLGSHLVRCKWIHLPRYVRTWKCLEFISVGHNGEIIILVGINNNSNGPDMNCAVPSHHTGLKVQCSEVMVAALDSMRVATWSRI